MKISAASIALGLLFAVSLVVPAMVSCATTSSDGIFGVDGSAGCTKAPNCNSCNDNCSRCTCTNGAAKCAAVCGVDSGGSAGSGVTPGCTKAPDCGQCTACFDKCVCQGGNATSCVSQCTGSGDSGTGDSGTGNGGQCSGKTATCQQIGFDKSADGGIGPCTTCMQSKCCTAIDGCFQNTTCAGLNDCIRANCASAKTAQELQTCIQQSCAACGSGAVSKFNAVMQCRSQSCKTECGGGAGGDSGICTSTIPAGTTCTQVGTGNNACDTCIHSNCCQEMNACFSDTTCSGLDQCIAKNCASITDLTQFNTCVSTTCGQCATQLAVTEHNAFVQCQKTSCSTQCK